jgi:hypothetical protein
VFPEREKELKVQALLLEQEIEDVRDLAEMTAADLDESIIQVTPPKRRSMLRSRLARFIRSEVHLQSRINFDQQ